MFLRPAAQDLLRRTARIGAATTTASILPTPRVARSAVVSTTSTNGPSPHRGLADAAAATAVGSTSHWANFNMAPPDPIIGLNEVSFFFVTSSAAYLPSSPEHHAPQPPFTLHSIRINIR